MKALITLALLCASALTAADLTGNWKGVAEGPQGTIERSFTFKQEGTKLTGETTSEFTGKSTITDGKVEGDDVTFSITADFQGNEMKLNYKGKISGDEIKLDVEFPGAPADAPRIQYVAKRVK
jgi:hypothetical protein